MTELFTRRQVLQISALSVTAGVLAGIGASEYIRNWHSDTSVRFWNLPHDGALDLRSDKFQIEGKMTGLANPSESIVVAIQGFNDNIRDPHFHPQSGPIRPPLQPGDLWAVQATFGFYIDSQHENLTHPVDFDVIAFWANREATQRMQQYANDGLIECIAGKYPGFLPEQLPTGLNEKDRARIHRLALSKSEIQSEIQIPS